ncbi:hypothetical protein DY000_02019863 [Brassica cretica]|uniref:Uncharacterized protein n=1 Tax=Brassica cretica TaxID=69181 RepID=A0ABQ7D3D1_BRACR|nr:hypothetical protein DY000_02019863 [Brassica cretica]
MEAERKRVFLVISVKSSRVRVNLSSVQNASRLRSDIAMTASRDGKERFEITLFQCKSNPLRLILSESQQRPSEKDASVKLKQLQYLLVKALPVLRDIYAEQNREPEVETAIRGVPVTESDITSDLCSTSIANFHRSCLNPDCSSDICLSCCKELREDFRNNQERDREKNAERTGQGKDSKANVPLDISNWKLNSDGSIPCPPKELGGCGTSTLELRRFINRDWSHWMRAEPVIVRNVLEKTSGLSWEPMVMWRACREMNPNVKCKGDGKSVKVLDCLDWCQVFDGYLKGRMDPSGLARIVEVGGLASINFQGITPSLFLRYLYLSTLNHIQVIKEWDVWTHLYLSGFTRSYKIWYHHGETDYEHGSTSEPQPAVRLEEPIRTDVDYGVAASLLPPTLLHYFAKREVPLSSGSDAFNSSPSSGMTNVEAYSPLPIAVLPFHNAKKSLAVLSSSSP